MPASPLTPHDSLELRRALLAWYRAHRRDLPWRRTRDPYRIWVSEIMLQQTRVAAVLDHYRRFLDRFPNLRALAEAPEPEVLALWSGLGYYRRARMLHRAAQAVLAAHHGLLPATAEALRALPGIGPYTSAAIASIAFDEPVAAVDGNVERVLARIAGWSAAATAFSARVRALADTLLDPQSPGDWNQAIMDLGATLCLPRSPLCLQCPVQPWCRTRGEHPTPAPVPMRARTVAFSLCTRKRQGREEILLVQRPKDASLMPAMWELPETPVDPRRPTLLSLRHSITTTNYSVLVYRSTPPAHPPLPHAVWVPAHSLLQFPLTGLARKILRHAGLLPNFAASPSVVDTDSSQP